MRLLPKLNLHVEGLPCREIQCRGCWWALWDSNPGPTD